MREGKRIVYQTAKKSIHLLMISDTQLRFVAGCCGSKDVAEKISYTWTYLLSDLLCLFNEVPFIRNEGRFFPKAGEPTVNSTGFPTGQNASAWVRMQIKTKGKFHVAFSYLN